MSPEPHSVEHIGTMDVGDSSVDLGRATSALRYATPDDLFRAQYLRIAKALAVWSGDREAAADAVQDAFVELVRRWDQVSVYDDPVAWVRRVSINRLRSHRRRIASKVAALARVGSDRGLEPAPAPQTTRLDLTAAFAGLSPKQRLAMSLFYVADLSTREVAHAMRCSEGSVHQHLHRGREALRRLMEAPR